MRGDLNVRKIKNYRRNDKFVFVCNQTALNPIPLYKQGVEEEKSELARLVNQTKEFTVDKKKKVFFSLNFSHHLLEQWLLVISLKQHSDQRAWYDSYFIFCFARSIEFFFFVFKDKILQCGMSGGPDAGRLLVTNDGATILSKIGIDNPVAKVLVGTCRLEILKKIFLKISLFRYFKSSR